jgi:hypothetical protein
MSSSVQFTLMRIVAPSIMPASNEKTSPPIASDPGSGSCFAGGSAVAHSLAGNEDLATKWTANAQRRNPDLSAEDFFRAFPIKPVAMRSRIATSLARLGFDDQPVGRSSI